MADLPITFSGPMVRGLLREIEAPGTGKTQTRRFPRIRGHRTFSEFGPSETAGYDWHFRDAQKRWHDYRHDKLLKRLPYAVGDRLYVREHWRGHVEYDDLAPSDMGGEEPILYLADERAETWGWGKADPAKWGRHRQAMHMPRWASRLTLTVTEVRVQRLQEISRDDAIAEGIQRVGGGMLRWENWTGAEGQSANSPQAAFALLWNTLHGPEAWSANPWVAAYSFQVRAENIDQIGDANA